MSRLWEPSTIREVLERHGFHFSKALGQNFLINGSVCPRMAASCGADKDTCVLEVGPGMGVLTWELSQVARKVVAVELDSRLFPVLDETLADCDNVEVVPGDVLKMDLPKLFAEKFPGEEICVCANLPYYITSPVIMRFLESGLPIRTVTVMVQKEAAKRICAKPGERECGAVSVSVQYHCEPKILFEVSRGSFMPPPNVDSAVIRLDLRKTPPVQVEDEPFFFALSRSAFAQRRKTAANSISAVMKIPKSQVEEGLEAAGAAKNSRAEQLSLEQFAQLANYLKNKV
jgi:16S rRNA (adenine1518-N6/adenine1519-N6)-dimethyltransferase